MVNQEKIRKNTTFKEFKEIREYENEELLKSRWEKFKEGTSNYKHYAKEKLIYNICEKFDLMIFDSRVNKVTHVIFKWNEDYNIYLCLKRFEVETLTKTKSNFSYLNNGQVTKGKLKGTRSERHFLKEIKTYIEEYKAEYNLNKWNN